VLAQITFEIASSGIVEALRARVEASFVREAGQAHGRGGSAFCERADARDRRRCDAGATERFVQVDIADRESARAQRESSVRGGVPVQCQRQTVTRTKCERPFLWAGRQERCEQLSRRGRCKTVDVLEDDRPGAGGDAPRFAHVVEPYRAQGTSTIFLFEGR